jgi:hypothetical protein
MLFQRIQSLSYVLSNSKFSFLHECIAVFERLLPTVSHMLHFTQYYSRIGSSSRFNFRANASPRSSQETCYKPILLFSVAKVSLTRPPARALLKKETRRAAVITFCSTAHNILRNWVHSVKNTTDYGDDAVFDYKTICSTTKTIMLSAIIYCKIWDGLTLQYEGW